MASAALSVIAVSRPSCSASCSSARLRGVMSVPKVWNETDVAGVVEKSVEVPQVPAQLPVRPRASCFLVPLRMLGRERRQLVEKPWPLVPGREVEPAPADQRFRLSTVKFGVRPVDEGEGRIRQKLTDRVRLCLDKRAVSFLALSQRFLCVTPLGHLHERDDDTVDRVVDGAVGTQPHQVPALGEAANLPIDGRELLENGSSVVGQTVVIELVGEIGDRPALVTRRDIEEIGDVGREQLDAKRGVEEEGSDIGRGHQVLQVAVGARDPFELELELVVDGLQLFVDRLQLLLARLELFRGRAVFLVDGLQLLVPRTQFLVGNLRVLARRSQLSLCLLQLFSKPTNRLAGRQLLVRNLR